jgi:hypothetical protein
VTLTGVDALVIALYLAASLAIGPCVARGAGASAESLVLAGGHPGRPRLSRARARWRERDGRGDPELC